MPYQSKELRRWINFFITLKDLIVSKSDSVGSRK